MRRKQCCETLVKKRKANEGGRDKVSRTGDLFCETNKLCIVDSMRIDFIL